ncbi:MAG: FHA domain-containing protein [Ignavibacteriales bacterium]|nr:MAG: FHA domain-containing protein [Ignavibacteriales bacterium]
MKLKLSISRQSDSSLSQQLDFNRFPVFIGREEKNDVILPDPFKVVSRKHAKIIDTEGILQLVDLEAPNFTYLNGERLLPNEENAIKTGDVIRVSDYELIVELVREVEKVADDDQKTMVFSSPFAEDVEAFAENLKLLTAKYALDDSPAKAEMFRISVLQSLSSIEKNDASNIIAEFFAESFLGRQIPAAPRQQEQSKPVFDFPESAIPKEVEPIAQQTKFKPAQTVSTDYSFNSHFTNTVDVLLDTFSKLIQGFLHFRQEFFGVTIYHTMPSGSLKELKEFLFNPDISSDEEKKRMDLLNEEIQKLLTHQLGLLEGYKISITEGSKSLLQSLDPELIEKELQSKQSGLDIGKILPITQKSKILDTIKDNYQKYMSDPYHIEKKYFRPAFMKGYQSRILAKKQINEY